MRIAVPALTTALISFGGAASALPVVINFEGNSKYNASDDLVVGPNSFDFYNFRFSGQELAFEAVGNEGTKYALDNTNVSIRNTTPKYPFLGGTLTDVQGFVDDSAFKTNDPVQFDRPRGGGDGLGKFFLRAKNGLGSGSSFDLSSGNKIFSINYIVAPTSMISGEIWDIDGFNGSEKWVVEAIGTNGTTILASQASLEYFTNGASSLDADKWVFSFDPTAPALVGKAISRLDFRFTGTKKTNIGVAFDNFTTGVVAVPGPAALPLMFSVLALFGWIGHRRRSA